MNADENETAERDFFISYTAPDLSWAEWIAWELEEAGYKTVIQAWDFRPGGNFILLMEEALERAHRTIAVLSSAYLRSGYATDERTAAFLHHTERKKRLLLVRVDECPIPRLLATLIYIDLVGLDSESAKERLLRGVQRGRAKPTQKPSFPGRNRHGEPYFPGHNYMFPPDRQARESGEPEALPPSKKLRPKRESDSSRGRMLLPGRTLLAVFPFRYHPGGGLDAFLVGGFCDDIVARLSKLHNLFVVGPDSLTHLIVPDHPAINIGRELGANAVLTGSVREFSRNLHINVHLIDADTAVTIWSEVFDFAYSELAQAHSQIATSVANALKLKLSPAEQANLSERTTDVVKAYELYLRATGLLATNEEKDLVVGLSMLDQAIELDQDFADAHAFKGYALWRKYFSGWDADVNSLSVALENARWALSLDPSSAAARMTLIRIYWDLGWHEKALAEGKAAFLENPGNLNAVLALARSYNNAGMADLSLSFTRSVLSIDKANPTALKLLIWNHVMVGEYERACQVASTYLPRQPSDSNTPWAAAIAHLHLGQHENAIEIAEGGLAADRFNFTLWALLGYIHRARGHEKIAQRVWIKGIEEVTVRLASFERNYRARSWLATLQAAVGKRVEATETIRSIQTAEPSNGYLLYRLAHAYAELNDVDAALNLLSASVERGFLSVQLMRCEEICSLRNILADARYQDIVTTIEESVHKLRVKYQVASDSYS
jgi:TolB-like protein/Flp pilus assembly protein TadD